MKNIFIVLLTFCCGLINAQKNSSKTLIESDSFQVINQYFNSQIKDKRSEIIVITEKLNPNVTLKIFEGQFPRLENEKDDYNELHGGATRPLFNDSAFKAMKNKFYDNKRYILPDITDKQWARTDLEFDKIRFISFVRFVANSNNANDVEINNLPNFLPVFGISEPIVYDKKYLVFQFHVTRTPFFGFSNFKVVVMKKIKKKWVVVQEIPSYELY
ncbi:hypothetical protein K6T82_22465 [Flavobacterium sp. 17A]|uniref:Uncharacterized protein n=1 Tax=Flavobacterium potami TaxID=2872310 RepID=A0A9X1HGG7_9FLAO|nr:hypothetical protein [Flavobacterium potami]MBZ4037542.1 hypothetical protein [Flavobacterium potami]